jgi:peroxiredoxin
MTILLRILLAVLLLWVPTPLASADDVPTIAGGALFPELQMALESPGDRAYLGLVAGGPFTPSQVATKVLLVELLNVHCVHCQMQTPAYNELFKLLEGNPVTRGNVKMLGVALGNLPGEVERFRQGYQVPFPVVADPQFKVNKALGALSTPFSIIVRQDRPGHAGIVVDTHSGLNTDYLRLAAQLQELTRADFATLRRDGETVVRARTSVVPPYGNEELELKVRDAFIATGGRILECEPVTLRSGRRVYTALMGRGDAKVRLFAEVTSRQSVCDICHDIHFIYLFNSSGRIVGFEPLQVTKYGNVLWTAAEAAQMRQHLVGQYLSAPRPFDPDLDAVTSATISSAMIFDSVASGEELLQELGARGLLD